jgi:hypothetical protein
LARAGVVDSSVPADGEEPPPEVFFAAAEPGQVTYHLQPGLAGDIVRVVAVQGPKESKQPRLQLPPQLKESRFVT